MNGNERRQFYLASSRGQPKRVNIRYRVAVGISIAIEGNSVGNLACDDVRVDEPAKLRRIVSCPHVEQGIAVCDDPISAIVTEDDFTCTRSRCLLAISVILERIGDGSRAVRDCNRAAAVVEVVGFESL